MRVRTRDVFRSIRAFLGAHRMLVAFTVLFLAGNMVGVHVFNRFGAVSGLFDAQETASVGNGIGEAIRFVFLSGLSGWLLLFCLYVTGLSPCGIPVAAAVPLFYGMGVGLCLAERYASGWSGVLFSAVLIVPHSLLCAAALLIGCCETARMSTQVGRQFLRSETQTGNLPEAFRLYSLRFLVLWGLVLLSAMVDVILRWLFYPLF